MAEPVPTGGSVPGVGLFFSNGVKVPVNGLRDVSAELFFLLSAEGGVIDQVVDLSDEG